MSRSRRGASSWTVGTDDTQSSKEGQLEEEAPLNLEVDITKQKKKWKKNKEQNQVEPIEIDDMNSEEEL